MHTVDAKKTWTEEELMALPRDGRKYELLGGELVVSPTGFQHGYVSARLATVLSEFVFRHRLGVVVDSSTGFRLKSGDCLSPDVSFVTKRRLMQQGGITPNFFKGPPDLAVEVISPRENRRRLEQKLAEYFSGGTQLVWVVDPKDKTVRVHSSAKNFQTFDQKGLLDGGSLLPGFTLAIKELFQIHGLESSQ